MDDQAPATPSPATDKFQALLEIAHRGDHSILPDLRAALDEHPEIWREYGDLAAQVERAWIQQVAGQDLLVHEALVRQMAAMRAELTGPSPTPVERLLVERAIACWLQLQFSDAAAVCPEGTSLRLAEFAMKRQDRAHRRYLTALGALETLRRLRPTEVTPQEASQRELAASGQSREGVLPLGEFAQVQRTPEQRVSRPTAS